MARGQRKTIEEKIAAMQELIEALETRVESEKRSHSTTAPRSRAGRITLAESWARAAS